MTQPVKPQQQAGGGWLAPNGDWYYCRYEGHDALAYALYEELEIPHGPYATVGAAALEAAGWLHVYDRGMIAPVDNWERATQAQLDCLLDLATAPDSAFDRWFFVNTPDGFRADVREVLEAIIRERDGTTKEVGDLIDPNMLE